MAAKKKTAPRSAKATVERDMPGWTVVKVGAGPKGVIKGAKPAKRAQTSAHSPSLDALKSKLTGRVIPKARKADAKTEKAQFVLVTPKSRPDGTVNMSKVALVRAGKVVARQG